MAGQQEETSGPKMIHIYPLIQFCDMDEIMQNEVVEFSMTACEKHAANYQMACKVIKTYMDGKFGLYWHCIVGEGYGFEVEYETDHLLHMYFGGNISILIWKIRQ